MELIFIIKEIENALQREGYNTLDINVVGIDVFYKILRERKRICWCIDLTGERYIDENNFIGFRNKIRNIFLQDENDNIEMLGIVITDNSAKRANPNEKSIKEIVQDIEGIWIADTKECSLIIYENQPFEFDNLKSAIEEAMEFFKIEKNKPFIEKVKEEGIKSFLRKYPMVTWGIILANVIVFIVLEVLGSTEDIIFMAEHGAGVVYYIKQGEYYRLFTEMFMHFGYEHLMNNMLVLYFIGEYVELISGKGKYIIIYLGSGLIASIVSFISNYNSEIVIVSAGASGAVFGVIGALVFLVIINKGQIKDITIQKLIIMIALSLYHGFVSSGIDNVAHIGGLVSGFVIALVLNLACCFRKNIIK